MAPFQAVPAPDAQPDKYSPERLAAGGRPVPDVHDETAPPVRMTSTPLPPRRRASEPERPGREDEERFAPWTTGPSGSIGQTGPPPPPSATYGDWTRPSRDQGEAERSAAGRAGRQRPAGPAAPRRAPAPLTSAIPERFADEPDSGEWEREDERSLRTDAGSRNVDRAGTPRAVGGRAALRAQRQAAEAERLKVARQQGERDESGTPRRGRGRTLILALVAVAVVSLGALGVYSFTSPKTQQAASTSAAGTPTAAPSELAAQATASVPPLVANAPAGATPAPGAAKVPITVLNETGVTGLAAKIASTFGGGGWPTTGVGAYKGNDVAATTVYFTQGDETQRQAATQLVAQFPKLSGPAPRFFDVPGTATPGLVVVAAGDWQP
jgi:hypothetical protein